MPTDPIAEAGTPSQPLIVVLKNRPAWMNDFLVEQIALIARPTGPHSSFDRQMLMDAAKALQANPWVRQVRGVRRAFTRRAGDTLEIDCDYRAGGAGEVGVFYWLVDEKGVRLSERFTEQDVPHIQFGPDHHTVIRVIEGVRRAPPELAGEKWEGPDLVAGLTDGKAPVRSPVAEEIWRVNVANFAGRIDNKDPQLVLVTKYGTQIWWGRPPGDNDVDSFIEVSTARKMRYLELTCQQYGHVDANEKWLDIRFDKVGRPVCRRRRGAAGQARGRGADRRRPFPRQRLRCPRNPSRLADAPVDRVALAALRVSLAAGYPQPGEFQAVRLVLAAQFAAAALLFPLLCRNWQTTLAAIASGCVMLLAAGLLAGWSTAAAGPACGLTALWVLSLAVCAQALPRAPAPGVRRSRRKPLERRRRTALVFQDGIESRRRAPGLWLGPLIGALIDPQSPGWDAWACAAAMLVSGALAGAFRLVVARYTRESVPAA